MIGDKKEAPVATEVTFSPKKIVEVKESNNVLEVNHFLQNGWHLHSVNSNNDKFCYLLVRRG